MCRNAVHNTLRWQWQTRRRGAAPGIWIWSHEQQHKNSILQEPYKAALPTAIWKKHVLLSSSLHFSIWSSKNKTLLCFSMELGLVLLTRMTPGRRTLGSDSKGSTFGNPDGFFICTDPHGSGLIGAQGSRPWMVSALKVRLGMTASGLWVHSWQVRTATVFSRIQNNCPATWYPGVVLIQHSPPSHLDCTPLRWSYCGLIGDHRLKLRHVSLLPLAGLPVIKDTWGWWDLWVWGSHAVLLLPHQ